MSRTQTATEKEDKKLDTPVKDGGATQNEYYCENCINK
jgi:hypothetical protein